MGRKERDSPRPQPELAAEHVTCNMAAPIQDKNNFYDMVGDNRNIEEVLETIRRSKHNPQQFWFVCNFHIHWGKGGKGSEQQDSIFLGTTIKNTVLKPLIKIPQKRLLRNSASPLQEPAMRIKKQ